MAANWRARIARVPVWSGRQGVEARRQALRESQARVLVDATHPFAVQMSQQLMMLAQELAFRICATSAPATWPPMIRTPAPTWRRPPRAPSPWAAASSWPPAPRTWQLPAGQRRRAPMVRPRHGRSRLHARALELGLPRAHLCAMQGPFSQAFNEALWRDWGIDCVVTKDSGEAGGYRAKVEAARALGIPLLTVRRPALDYPQVAHDLPALQAQLAALAGD
jgi:precorrin-3B C17-methyltransferase